LWRIIPNQFAKENHKFAYKTIEPSARGRDYAFALDWLIDAGLIYKIDLVPHGDKLPLSFYANSADFKVYMLDLGLLRRLTNYWIGNADNSLQSKGKSELDFIISLDNQIIPIEVKSGYNVKAQSLRVYRNRYNPELSIRFSLKNLEYNEGLLNIPLYYSFLLKDFMSLKNNLKQFYLP